MIDTPVTAVTAAAYTIPTDTAEADGTLAWQSTTLVLVQVSAGRQVGTGWTYAPAAAAAVVAGILADLVTGADPVDVPGLHENMVRAIRNAGRPGIAGCALSAVDLALWDLKARLWGVPLHRLLGAPAAVEVPVYGSGGFTTYRRRQLEAQLSGWVQEQSIPRVKIKIGQGWGTRTDRDLDRIRQARRIIGEDTELYVDANGAYGRKQAVRLAAESAEENVVWFEEPVSSDDLDGLSRIRQVVRPDVTAGEYGYDLAYFERMCTAGAVDCLQADITRCGGITDWLKVAAVAAAHNLEISGHCAPHAHAHAAATIPNLRHLEWFHDHVRIEQRFFDGAFDPTGGSVRPDPHAPGHGLTLRAPDIAPFQVA
ncbi:enolase C-terminal domain-like protein [Rhodococcus phenolicus]|uniref:enolase C-terminal domain-like protein n=1 Tax=Rhodococcus phenolicus TaxID=263849 RepID=UPI000836BE15|nr:enolase C-terminal domain-like protein [Rhodococcus phenolicus]